MGTPDFAAASLEKLLAERFDVVGVFTQPDRDRVVAESSYVQRCIQSLANFTMVLKAQAPQL